MHSIIFTSADHCYANALLGGLVRRGVFDGHTVLVLEQHGLIPGKTKLEGLIKYLRVSGISYVGWQIAKQLLFQLVRAVSSFFNERASPFFPYWRLAGAGGITRESCPRLSTPEAIARVRAFAPDLILSLYSKDIIPERIFSLPKKGCVNLHPAPLPYYKGISPTFWILARGDKTAGVSLHHVDAGIDTGKIIAQTLFPVASMKDEHALYMKATMLGASLVEEFMKGISRGGRSRMKQKAQRQEGSYFRLPTRDAVGDFFACGCRFFTIQDFIRP